MRVLRWLTAYFAVALGFGVISALVYGADSVGEFRSVAVLNGVYFLTLTAITVLPLIGAVFLTIAVCKAIVALKGRTS